MDELTEEILVLSLLELSGRIFSEMCGKREVRKVDLKTRLNKRLEEYKAAVAQASEWSTRATELKGQCLELQQLVGEQSEFEGKGKDHDIKS